nr:hypothetical protein CFP56_09138 [Quercus suber]
MALHEFHAAGTATTLRHHSSAQIVELESSRKSSAAQTMDYLKMYPYQNLVTFWINLTPSPFSYSASVSLRLLPRLPYDMHRVLNSLSKAKGREIWYSILESVATALEVTVRSVEAIIGCWLSAFTDS